MYSSNVKRICVPSSKSILENCWEERRKIDEKSGKQYLLQLRYLLDVSSCQKDHCRNDNDKSGIFDFHFKDQKSDCFHPSCAK